AAERGHTVTLYEKNAALGGAIRCEKDIPFKQDYFNNIRVMELLMEKEGVRVIKGQAFTPEIAEALKPDAVIVAVGAEPILPPIPGIDHPKVVSANSLSDDDVKIGQSVVILGGGLVGCEAAVYLAMQGKAVTVVEMLSGVCIDANIKHGPMVRNKMAEFDVKIMTETKGLEVTDEGLVVSGRDAQKQILAADTIVVAVGQRSLRGTVESLKDTAPLVLYIGDCVKPGNLAEAMTGGYYAGLDI
ncbi:MAG: NAD(P)/FAD-dependent oxidoreductase, partial [Clostridiales Family XIII bacterium]|nr:NAD(P)/FAD-dependent oxidoreductase [Clostridiales Family XIII bacterium]